MPPELHLAGEVDGLAPSAVTESPIEPRLFVLGRRGAAREVVCPEEIRKTEKLAVVSQDTSKYSSEVIAPKSDLGGSLSHTYFTRRHDGTGASTGLNFSDVYPRRRWHGRSRVSAAFTALSLCVPPHNLPVALGRPPVPASAAPPAVYEARSYGVTSYPLPTLSQVRRFEFRLQTAIFSTIPYTISPPTLSSYSGNDATISRRICAADGGLCAVDQMAQRQGACYQPLQGEEKLTQIQILHLLVPK
jgi:hypothetical protein